ncbi:MAG: MarR family winged helix-turn-helix transcriptional regulator [Candidatus Micrarchaeaceae archaeon]
MAESQQLADGYPPIIFKKKHARLLLALKNKNKEWHISDLANDANVTYVHTTKFINECEKYGIISIEKHGRIKTINLTSKGNHIVESIQSIINDLNEKGATGEPQTGQQQQP